MVNVCISCYTTLPCLVARELEWETDHTATNLRKTFATLRRQAPQTRTTTVAKLMFPVWSSEHNSTSQTDVNGTGHSYNFYSIHYITIHLFFTCCSLYSYLLALYPGLPMIFNTWHRIGICWARHRNIQLLLVSCYSIVNCFLST